MEDVGGYIANVVGLLLKGDIGGLSPEGIASEGFSDAENRKLGKFPVRNTAPVRRPEEDGFGNMRSPDPFRVVTFGHGAIQT